MRNLRLSRCALLWGVLVFVLPVRSVELTGRDYAVELTANIATDPPEITLVWPGDQYARGYTIRRKLRNETTWQDIATAEGPSTGFTDHNVQVGVGYEYQVVKDSSYDITAYGYIYAGINLPLVEDRGGIIVVSEENLASALAPELLRLEYDLIGEGWTVQRLTVSATNSPPDVKAKIKTIYARDPDRTRALLLFGHVPVAYSGNIMPDGHDNHHGAWPADVYYADLDGSWTDSSVTSTNAEVRRNWNVPGDGKFDQDEPPSSIELWTGRVDLSRLTCFQNKTPSRSEIDLARQYLEKNHRFRTGANPVSKRAILFDRIESKTAEPVASMAWRNFAPLVGRDVQQIDDFQYFPTVAAGTYLWSSVTSGGSETGSDHVGSSDAFALSDVNVTFTTFLGSYFGDWDVESAFLRAALGSHGTLLTTAYSGQPQWLFHHMGLGEAIGYSAKITQENNENGIYLPHNNGAGQVHVALLGDPSLRAYPIPGVQNLRGEVTADGMVAGWQLPAIDGGLGCLVYTASSPKGPYRRVTPDPITGTSFLLRGAQPTDFVMVKTLALTRTPSGSFYNTSVGSIWPDPLAQLTLTPPQAPTKLSVAKVAPDSITITWLGNSAGTLGYRIERKDPGTTQFHEIASLAGDAWTYSDSALAGPGYYTYRVRAFNQAGSSGYSTELVATTASGSAEFVGYDTTTQGNWIGFYGNEGFIIPGQMQSLPPNCSITVSNALTYETILTDDARMPQLTNNVLRSRNCWVNGINALAYGFNINFSDDLNHQVAIYASAWSRRDPQLVVDVLDAVSGSNLDHRSLPSVNEGLYAIYNVRHQVLLQVTPPSSYTNAEIYGIFVDPAIVAPLQLQPPPGAFPGRVQVSLSTITPNADIRYTTDGTDPGPNSMRYTGPLSLRSSTHLKARAFRDGFAPSPLVEGQYDNTLLNIASVTGTDTATSGNWPFKYGQEGHWLAMSDPSFPAVFEASLEGASLWTWSDQANDERALIASAGGDLRQARAWYSSDPMTLNLGVYDTQMHAVSLYFLDYDNSSRVEQVELLDAVGISLGKVNIDNFSNGEYLNLVVQGAVQVRITPLHGPNAVLSGVFVDPAPAALSLLKPAPLTDTVLNDQQLQFNTPAFPGLRLYIDRSSNLVDWQCIATNSVPGTSAALKFNVDFSQPKYFFRTHLAP